MLVRRGVQKCIKVYLPDVEWSAACLQAQLIEANAEAVDQAINAVRVALAQGLSWAELERLIREEAAAGNQVAGLVHALHLDRNAVTLVLPDWITAADRDADLDDADLDSDAESDDEDGDDGDDVPTALVSSLPRCLACVLLAQVGSSMTKAAMSCSL